MGMSYSTLRWVAPLSFAIDFAAQQYGMFSKPNMLDIHEKRLSFFSPNPMFIPAFFFPQQLLQLAWLYRLCTLSTTDPTQRREFEIMADYVPYYAVGNLCIAVWMLFWNADNLPGSFVPVAINTLTQLAYLPRLQPLSIAQYLQPAKHGLSLSTVLTHAVAKSFAGIGVLDLLHNFSAGFFPGVYSPSALYRVAAGVGLVGTSYLSGGDAVFGGSMIFNSVALAVGQYQIGQDGGWATTLAGVGAACAAIVGLRAATIKA